MVNIRPAIEVKNLRKTFQICKDILQHRPCDWDKRTLEHTDLSRLLHHQGRNSFRGTDYIDFQRTTNYFVQMSQEDTDIQSKILYRLGKNDPWHKVAMAGSSVHIQEHTQILRGTENNR